MSRHRHDTLAKEVFKLWLDPLGDVFLDARIAGEARRGDVLFIERHRHPRHRRSLGLLGQLARGTVLFELFRNPFTLPEFDSCLAKRIELYAHTLREARRTRMPAEAVPCPFVCVVVPSLSSDRKRACGISVRSGGGVYPLIEALRVIVVVVEELPTGQETLWLRLLGRGAVQRRAIAELLGRMKQEPLVDATMKIVTTWRESLPPAEEQLPEEREQMENWQKVYNSWEKRVKTQAWIEGEAKGRAEGEAKGRAEGEAKGRAEGEAEGKASAIVAVLRGRGLTVTTAQEKRIRGCSSLATLDRWLLRALAVESTAELLPATRSKSAKKTPTTRRKGRVTPRKKR